MHLKGPRAELLLRPTLTVNYLKGGMNFSEVSSVGGK
jgi:hypothetical protein